MTPDNASDDMEPEFSILDAQDGDVIRIRFAGESALYRVRGVLPGTGRSLTLWLEPAPGPRGTQVITGQAMAPGHDGAEDPLAAGRAGRGYRRERDRAEVLLLTALTIVVFGGMLLIGFLNGW